MSKIKAMILKLRISEINIHHTLFLVIYCGQTIKVIFRLFAQLSNSHRHFRHTESANETFFSIQAERNSRNILLKHRFTKYASIALPHLTQITQFIFGIRK